MNKNNSKCKNEPVLVIPMAGFGRRFEDAGFTKIKPLIQVNGEEIIIKVLDHYKNFKKKIFILRSNMKNIKELINLLKDNYQNSNIIILDKETNGQATSAYLGLKEYKTELKKNLNGLVTFGTCDGCAIYNETTLLTLQSRPDIDIIVWGIRKYMPAIENPKMFSWVSEKKNNINKIFVKNKPNNVNNDPIIIGIFTFKNIDIYNLCYESNVINNGITNGEFYIDGCINEAIKMGYKCHLMEVDRFLSWGTPQEVNAYLTNEKTKK
jgi:NDP-sugar pyrophosphorylase family protein